MFLLLLITVEVKNTMCNSLITMFTTSWRNLIKIGWSELYKILSFLQKAISNVKHSDISLAPFWKSFLQVKQFIWFKASIFCYSKNYGSLTHETIMKDAVNMEDLICLLATVRTLKGLRLCILPHQKQIFLHKGALPWTPVKGFPLDPIRDPIGGPGPHSWVLALRTWYFSLQAIPKSWKPCRKQQKSWIFLPVNIRVINMNHIF